MLNDNRVFGRAVRGRQERQAPEIRSRDDQQLWTQPAVDDLATDEHDAVVGDALRRHEELHCAFPERRPSLGLHRDVGAVGQAVKQGVDPAIQERAKHVKVSSRLLHQESPDSILEDLARGARLVPRPGPPHEDLG